MRVVITGATGNVGTSLLQALASEPSVEEIVGLVRRVPQRPFAKTSFHKVDIVTSELVDLLRGADAVVHLAWLIQPGRDESVTSDVNVLGTRRLLRAVVEARVPALVYASSVGAYSPGPKDRAVDESWPTEGIQSSFYSRHKAAVERMLDTLELEQPELRVVRMRPGLIFKRQAATQIRRLFLGPLVPNRLIKPSLIPVVPDVPRLRFQAVHSADVGDAYRRALISDAGGAFNLAAEPVIGPGELAKLLNAQSVKVPAAALRGAAAAAYALRLVPSEPGWLDMALAVPVMDCARAQAELGWKARHSGLEALRELLDGLHDGADQDTPPLARATGGSARWREFLTGVGRRP
jgi:nucleoside-diphosphate-sugar epimerase